MNPSNIANKVKKLIFKVKSLKSAVLEDQVQKRHVLITKLSSVYTKAGASQFIKVQKKKVEGKV